MTVNMLTGSLAMYESFSRKVTLSDFIKDNFFMVLLTILKLLQKARKAEAAAKKAAYECPCADHPEKPLMRTESCA